MNNTHPPTGARRFVIEASNSNPAMRHGYERDNLADYEVLPLRRQAEQRARYFLRRGYWVEIYDDASRELLAGPFDPDQDLPAFII